MQRCTIRLKTSTEEETKILLVVNISTLFNVLKPEHQWFTVIDMTNEVWSVSLGVEVQPWTGIYWEWRVIHLDQITPKVFTTLS